MIFGDRWLWTCPHCPENYWVTSCDTYVRALLTARGHLLERHSLLSDVLPKPGDWR